MSDAPFTSDVYAARRDKLRARLKQAGHTALLVSHDANRYYLSGFELHDPQCNESSGLLLVCVNGQDKLLTDPRFLDAAKRLWPPDDIFIYSSRRNQQISQFLKQIHQGPLAFESRAMSVDTHAQLSQNLELAPSHGLVESLRRLKEPEEIERLDKSCALNQQVMDQIRDLARPGLTEAQAAWLLERRFRELGASELAFAPIVAAGANAALPHAVPGQAVIGQEGLLLVDMGGRYLDYCSDQTRTIWTGQRPPEHFRRALELTQLAQAKAISALRPGMQTQEAYAVARGFFEKYGVEKAFTHSLGHGLGLETHEAPSLSPMGDGLLEPGMVVTVEPGLYYPEWGGVRWEHTVVITEDGCQILGQDHG